MREGGRGSGNERKRQPISVKNWHLWRGRPEMQRRRDGRGRSRQGIKMRKVEERELEWGKKK